MPIIFHLEQLLNERNISKYNFSHMTGIRWNTIDAYCNNQIKRIAKEDLELICKVLNCQLHDLIEYIPD